MVKSKNSGNPKLSVIACLIFALIFLFGCSSIRELKPPEAKLEPLYIWLHWDFEGALHLDTINQVMWEVRCNQIGGVTDWDRIIAVGKYGDMKFTVMGCYSPEVLERLKNG